MGRKTLFCIRSREPAAASRLLHVHVSLRWYILYAATTTSTFELLYLMIYDRRCYMCSPIFENLKYLICEDSKNENDSKARRGWTTNLRNTCVFLPPSSYKRLLVYIPESSSMTAKSKESQEVSWLSIASSFSSFPALGWTELWPAWPLAELLHHFSQDRFTTLDIGGV